MWFEITTLLIPDENDSNAELEQMTRWIADKLGPDVPLHFTAFHPDWKMMDKPRTPRGDADACARDRAEERPALRLHRQRARPRGFEHVLRRLRQPRDRARLVRAGRVAAGCAGPLPAVRARSCPASSTARRAPGVPGACRSGLRSRTLEPPLRPRTRTRPRRRPRSESIRSYSRRALRRSKNVMPTPTPYSQVLARSSWSRSPGRCRDPRTRRRHRSK